MNDPGYPRPVQVIYPNGMEEVGVALSDDRVQVGAIGFHLELHDVLKIDGASRRVTGINQEMKGSTDSQVRVFVDLGPQPQ